MTALFKFLFALLIKNRNQYADVAVLSVRQVQEHAVEYVEFVVD
jgi:hypothetical protein